MIVKILLKISLFDLEESCPVGKRLFFFSFPEVFNRLQTVVCQRFLHFSTVSTGTNKTSLTFFNKDFIV